MKLSARHLKKSDRYAEILICFGLHKYIHCQSEAEKSSPVIDEARSNAGSWRKIAVNEIIVNKQ